MDVQNHEQRRARAKPSSKTWRKRKLKIFVRDDWTCWICGGKVNPSVGQKAKTYPTVDHIIPWSEGGTWTQDNLRTAHRGCNNKRHNGHV